MMELGLARQEELSSALQVDRSTLYRQHRKVKAEGVLGVVDGKRGPRARIGSRPTSANAWPDCWRRRCRSARRRSRWASPKARFATRCGRGELRGAEASPRARCAGRASAARAMRSPPGASGCSGTLSGRWRGWGS